MAPPPKRRAQKISQEAFDAVVMENVEEFGMDMAEALNDAVKTFQLQSVDLTGIVTDGSGSSSADSHPVIKAVKDLENVMKDASILEPQNEKGNNIFAWEEANIVLENLRTMCEEGGANCISIAGRNGGVQALMSACQMFKINNVSTLALALKALAILLTDYTNREDFRQADGAQMIMGLLVKKMTGSKVIAPACQVMAAAATGDEIAKELFMDLNVVEVLPTLLQEHATDEDAVRGICSAFCSLVTADDGRVLASKTFDNARKFAKKGMVEAILEATKKQSQSSIAVGALCISLRSLAANEEICKSVADLDGLSLILNFLERSIEEQDKLIAKNACSLLSQLAGSDDNKDEIIFRGGLNKIAQVMSIYSNDPSVLQEAMMLVGALSLRSPTNAVKAVEAGIVDLVAEAMENHPSVASMQRSACQMLRNLAVRSLENRSFIIEKGLEALVRSAKEKHPSCRDAASAALRDLGFDDYNR